MSYIVGTILSTMETKARNCLTEKKKYLILANHDEGKWFSEIVGILRRLKSIAYRVISRFKATKSLEPKPGIGSLL